MLIDGENQGLPLRYFLDLTDNPPLAVESYDKAQILYVVTEPNLNINNVQMYEISAFGAFEIEKSWPIENGINLVKLVRPQV